MSFSVSNSQHNLYLKQIQAGATFTAHATAFDENLDAVLTIPAPPSDTRILIKTVYFGYSAEPTAGTLTIAPNLLPSMVIPVTSPGAGFLEMPLAVPSKQPITFTLSAGGVGVTGYVSCIYTVVEV